MPARRVGEECVSVRDLNNVEATKSSCATPLCFYSSSKDRRESVPGWYDSHLSRLIPTDYIDFYANFRVLLDALLIFVMPAVLFMVDNKVRMMSRMDFTLCKRKIWYFFTRKSAHPTIICFRFVLLRIFALYCAILFVYTFGHLLLLKYEPSKQDVISANLFFLGLYKKWGIEKMMGWLIESQNICSGKKAIVCLMLVQLIFLETFRIL